MNGRKLLLIVAVATMTTVRGHPTRRESGDDSCPGDFMAHNAFFECENIYPGPVDGQLTTISDLKEAVSLYCRTKVPLARQCFNDEISSCPTDVYRRYTELADRTGILCQAGTNTTNDVIDHLLSELDGDAPTMGSAGCGSVRLGDCNAAAADQVNSIRPIDIRNDSAEEISEWLNSHAQIQTACLIAYFRERQSTCPEWRSVAATVAITTLRPQFLGMQQTYTTQQLLQEFELPSP